MECVRKNGLSIIDCILKLVGSSQNIFRSGLCSPLMHRCIAGRGFPQIQVAGYCSQSSSKNILNNCKNNFNKNMRLFKESSLETLKVLYNDIKSIPEDFTRKLEMASTIKEKGEIDMLFTFEDENSIDKFTISSDSQHSIGFSWATFTCTQNKTGLFSGFIDTTVPKDGKTNYTGYANITSRSFKQRFFQPGIYDWREYSHLVFKVRGDGRTYFIILATPFTYSETTNFQYHYPLYTRGGPYWQLSKIPFSNFYFTKGGKVCDEQSMMPLNECTKVGITLSDHITGPFKLEIDYIGLENQPLHRHISPYESYAQ